MEDYSVVNEKLQEVQRRLDDWIAAAVDPSDKAERAITALQLVRLSLWSSREVISHMQHSVAALEATVAALQGQQRSSSN